MKIYLLPILLLAACGVAGSPPGADPKVTADIVKACTNSGYFKLADGIVALAVPQATLPIALVNAGVDKVCANPETFSTDATTAIWVAQQLTGAK